MDAANSAAQTSANCEPWSQEMGPATASHPVTSGWSTLHFCFFSTNAPGSKVSKEEPDWLNLRTIVPAWFEGFRGASQSSGTVESGSDCSEHSEE